MNNYIIDVVHAFDVVCNLGLGISFFVWVSILKEGIGLDMDKYEIRYFNPLLVTTAICLLGVLFIPSKSTLMLLLP